jgi:hypothetical protein
MKKKRKPLLTVLVVFVIFFAALGIITYAVLHTDNQCKDWKGMYDQKMRYHWLFDSTKNSFLDCPYPTGNASQKRYRFLYTYNNQHRYFIVEEHNINNVRLNNIKDTIAGLSSDDYNINPHMQDDMGWGGHLTFTSKVCTDSSNTLQLIFDKDSKVVRTDSLNRIVFSGLIKRVLIQNEFKENQHLLAYDNLTPTSIILYRPGNTLYFIIVNAFEGRSDVKEAMENLNLK